MHTTAGIYRMGYIRRIEVKGFKSFGPRALTITFEQGLNVVTGPNGSGKSNIADAILFALGENSPRTLRAAQGRLTGLIYDPKREAAAEQHVSTLLTDLEAVPDVAPMLQQLTYLSLH